MEEDKIKSLVKATLLLGVSSTGVLLLGILSNKIVALYLGPEGLGVLALLIAFIQTVVTTCNIGSDGIIKYISEYRARKYTHLLNTTFSTLLLVFIPLSLMAFLICILFAKPLAIHVLNDSKLARYIIIAAPGILVSIISVLFNSLLKGYKDIKALARVNIIGSFAGLALLFPLIYFFGLLGAMIEYTISSVFALGVVWFFLRRVLKMYQVKLIVRLDKHFLWSVLKYGIAAQISGMAITYSTLFVKSYIVRELGYAQNGLYQAAIAITSYVLIIRRSMSTYFFPHISEFRENFDITRETNQAIRVSLLITTPVIFICSAFIPFLTRILYSDSFMGITGFAVILYLYLWCTSQSSFLGNTLVALGKLKVSVSLQIVWGILYISLTIVLLPLLDIKGAALSYTIPYFILYPLSAWYLHKAIQFRFDKSNFKLQITSLLVVVLGSVIMNQSLYIKSLGVGVVFAWFIFSLTKQERFSIIEEVRKYLRFRKGSFDQ